MEEWKGLQGHPNYLVSTHGRIKRKDTGKTYSGTVNNRGYIRFDLSDNGKRFVVSGHRAVAETFLIKTHGKNVVNHKDGNKRNNNVDNLEWCTYKENSIHAVKVLKIPPSKTIPVTCIETGIVYKSMLDAERKTGIKASLIYRCITGERKTTHGFHWNYAEIAQR